jgi:hypothetical protein
VNAQPRTLRIFRGTVLAAHQSTVNQPTDRFLYHPTSATDQQVAGGAMRDTVGAQASPRTTDSEAGAPRRASGIAESSGFFPGHRFRIRCHAGVGIPVSSQIYYTALKPLRLKSTRSSPGSHAARARDLRRLESRYRTPHSVRNPGWNSGRPPSSNSGVPPSARSAQRPHFRFVPRRHRVAHNRDRTPARIRFA